MAPSGPGTGDLPRMPDYTPVPETALGPALNEQGYFVGRVERNLYWVTDGTYQSAFLVTRDGVVLFDAPPTIGHNLRRAVDEIAETEGLAMTSALLIALFVGLSVSLIGAGVALGHGRHHPTPCSASPSLSDWAFPSRAGHCCDAAPGSRSRPQCRQ